MQPAPVAVPVIVPVEPFIVKPIYIVNHGPVYGGPGIITRALKKDFMRPLSDYPYVSHDYSYPEYYAVPKRRYVRHRYDQVRTITLSRAACSRRRARARRRSRR